MAKILSFLIDNVDSDDFKKHVSLFKSAKLYEEQITSLYDGYEDAGDSLLGSCSDGEYTDYCYDCACDTLDDIFKTMDVEVAKKAVIHAYDSAKWIRTKEHIFSLICNNYYKYEYDDVLKHLIDSALQETDIDIVMRAAETALEYYETEYRPRLEKMDPFDSVLGKRFWNQILYE